MSEKKHSVFTFSQSGKKPEWVCIEVEPMLNTFDIKIVCGELIVRKRNLSKSIHLQHIYLAGEFHILLIIQQQNFSRRFHETLLHHQHILLLLEPPCEKNFESENFKSKPKVKLIREKFSVLQLLSKQNKQDVNCVELCLSPRVSTSRADNYLTC